MLTALLIGALCAQTLAADFQAGVEAFERGDYAVALREFRPLAEQGMAVPLDPAEAMKWLLLAGEQGDASAQRALDVMYGFGIGVPEDDAEAVKWYRKGAEQGDPMAQYFLEGPGLNEFTPAPVLLHPSPPLKRGSESSWMNYTGAEFGTP